MDHRLAAYLATVGVSADALAGWSVNEVHRAGELVGFFLSLGTEIHFLPLVVGKAISRRNLIAALKPILDEHGYCTTRVPANEHDHRLRVKLGFKQTYQTPDYTFWALTELPYERHSNAQ